jgi:hypothetical protein
MSIENVGLIERSFFYYPDRIARKIWVLTESDALSHVLVLLIKTKDDIFMSDFTSIIEAVIQFSSVYSAPYLIRVGALALYNIPRVRKFYNDNCKKDPFSHVFFDFLFTLMRFFGSSYLAGCLNVALSDGDILALSLKSLEQLRSTLTFTFTVTGNFSRLEAPLGFLESSVPTHLVDHFSALNIRSRRLMPQLFDVAQTPPISRSAFCQGLNEISNAIAIVENNYRSAPVVQEGSVLTPIGYKTYVYGYLMFNIGCRIAHSLKIANESGLVP